MSRVVRLMALRGVISILRPCVTDGNVISMSDTAAHIIDSKGGPASVAAVTGKTPGAVRVWKHRNLIPREAWPEVMTAFPDITLAKLIATEKAAGAAGAADLPQVVSAHQ